MNTRRAMDRSGATMLIGIATLLAFNQVVIKVTGGGFGPVFQAGLRSGLGAITVLIWMQWRRIPIDLSAGILVWGAVNGCIFAFEFICLFIALDLTTVSRASVIFYSMPVWLALAGHFWLPSEQLSKTQFLGLFLALGGVALALSDRNGGHVSLWGDLLALAGAMFWAGIALVMRLTPLSRASPEAQMLVIVTASTPVLLGLAPFFGDMVRDPGPLHLIGLVFQSVFIVGLAYLLWAWLISEYRAGEVASFSFLTPIIAVILGWLLLGEQIGPQVWIALGLVSAGVFLINRK